MAGTADIERAVARLASGGLVAFPTETVYGLGASAIDPDAVGRVFTLKGRPAGNPLIVHVADEAMAHGCVSHWPDMAGLLAAAFWPGPLTLVLPRAETVPDVVTGGGQTVAVRAPDHGVAIALIEAFGEPIVGPSANPSGYVSPTQAEHVRSHFSEDDVLVLDGGPCRAGIESTVVDLASSHGPRVLRRGVIGAGEIAAVLGVPVGEAGGGAGESETSGGVTPGSALPAASPGLMGPHYQPRAGVFVYRDLGDLNALLAGVAGHALVLSPPGLPISAPPPHIVFPMPALPEDYAAEFYSALREGDACDASVVLVGEPMSGPSPVWLAVRDRLGRASMSAREG